MISEGDLPGGSHSRNTIPSWIRRLGDQAREWTLVTLFKSLQPFLFKPPGFQGLLEDGQKHLDGIEK